MHTGFQWVGIAFWAFVAVSAVAGIVSDYNKKRLVVELLKAAIDRGQQLDPVVVEKLVGKEQRGDEELPQNLQMGGIITVAGGVGLALLSLFLRDITRIPFAGLGVLAVCVGIGLIIASRQLQRGRGARRD